MQENHTETEYHVGLTDLRFDPNYVLWYINITKIVSTGKCVGVLNYRRNYGKRFYKRKDQIKYIFTCTITYE